MKTPNNKYKCTFCNYQSDRRYNLMIHQRNRHREKISTNNLNSLIKSETPIRDTVKRALTITARALRKSIVKDEQEYKHKIKLGRELYIYINAAKILKESLSKEGQAALDLYINEFHPIQTSLDPPKTQDFFDGPP
jgi:hypothetical protein